MKIEKRRLLYNQTNPEEVLKEVKNRVNDAEIMQEIKSKFDFSGDNSFLNTFKKDYENHMRISSIFKDSVLQKSVLNMESDEIYTIASETIVLKYGRPSLLIQNNLYEIPESDVWKDRLNNGSILQNIPSVGRIELKNHSRFDWVGTGWLLRGTDFIVTNRHVAQEFATGTYGNYVFRHNFDGYKIGTSVDFKREFRISEEAVFKVEKVLYIAPEKDPDVAILKINRNSGDDSLPDGLEISSTPATNDSFVYTLGYPARDSRIKDTALMERIFKSVYNVKRLAPGKLINTSTYKNEYQHDCSTLGGNSGSPVIDLFTGKVVGLHHAGTYRKCNWAVQCEYLNNLITDLR